MLPTRIRSTSRPCFVSPFGVGFDDEFDRVVSRWFADRDAEPTGAYPVDIHEDDQHVYVDAELPGFDKDQIEVTFENGVLTIVAERNGADKDEGQAAVPGAVPGAGKKGHVHLAERRFTRVARSFTLPNTIDGEKIDAKLDKGVLHLTLHKREEVKPRRIDVN